MVKTVNVMLIVDMFSANTDFKKIVSDELNRKFWRKNNTIKFGVI